MPDLSTTLKREGVTLAWVGLIKQITGETPIVTRLASETKIQWRPGQAKKMETYLSNLLKPGEPDPEGINVKVDLKPVLLPLAFKKAALPVALYTGAAVGLGAVLS